MKKLLVFSYLSILPALCQTPPLAGFIFANASGLPGKVVLKVEGRDVSMGGYDSGMATSGLGFPVGSKIVEAEAEGVESARETVNVQVGKCPILLAYTEIFQDPDGKEKTALRFHIPEARPEQNKTYSSRLLYLPKRGGAKAPPLEATVNGERVALKPFNPMIKEGKNLSIIAGGQELPDPDLELPGNYVIAIFQNANGDWTSVVIPEIIYVW